jgi:rhamnopyranosyl-N-acetylglucosaminyl-diphospho-decaprenol beta-1,3/1,4-galactofuranosyltransferase
MMSQSTDQTSVCVVTVTYGRRWHLLKCALASARNEGADQAVVIDNGSLEDIAQLAVAEFGAFVDVVTLDRNIGSAEGFGTGFARALEIGAKLRATMIGRK